MLFVKIRKQFPADGLAPFVLDVDTVFPTGFTVLFGPSGAGKSTLLDCIAGLQQPDSGEIRLGDETLFDAARKIFTPPQHRALAYVFQSLALFPHLSVEQNIRYGVTKLGTTEAVTAVFSTETASSFGSKLTCVAQFSVMRFIRSPALEPTTYSP